MIPCLDEAEHIGPLIDLMLRDPAIDRLVVADGGSTDGSTAIVRERIAEHGERLALLGNPARIQSAGVNRAVARHGAGHEWLLRIDAHCVYPANYATRLLASARAHAADAVVVPMETVGTRGWQRAIAAAQNSALGTGGSPHRHVTGGRWVDHGHHALMRLDRFARLGGYCEAMPCNEDAELDVRQAEGRCAHPARARRGADLSSPSHARRVVAAISALRHWAARAPSGGTGSRSSPVSSRRWRCWDRCWRCRWPSSIGSLALPAAAWLAGCLLGGLALSGHEPAAAWRWRAACRRRRCTSPGGWASLANGCAADGGTNRATGCLAPRIDRRQGRAVP